MYDQERAKDSDFHFGEGNTYKLEIGWFYVNTLITHMDEKILHKLITKLRLPQIRSFYTTWYVV